LLHSAFAGRAVNLWSWKIIPALIQDPANSAVKFSEKNVPGFRQPKEERIKN
jgi:hypothetical protein